MAGGGGAVGLIRLVGEEHQHGTGHLHATVTEEAAGPLPRVGWTIVADSQETAAGNVAAANVSDGDAATIWHTCFTGVSDPLPHSLTIDTQAALSLGGLTYRPRPAASPNGRIGQYRVEVSADGVIWARLSRPVRSPTMPR
jgi:hypothetical protein